MTVHAPIPALIDSRSLGLSKNRVLARVPATLCLLLCVAAGAPSAHAGSPMADQTSSGAIANPSENTRYGLFGLLDHRSAYGQGVFPEPFLVDDSDLEVNEARLDWFHSGVANAHSDLVTAEVEKGFGLLTLEVEVPYERDAVERVTHSPSTYRRTAFSTRPWASRLKSVFHRIRASVETGNGSQRFSTISSLVITLLSNPFSVTRSSPAEARMAGCKILNTVSCSATQSRTTNFRFLACKI
jgi:hypothetical protein